MLLNISVDQKVLCNDDKKTTIAGNVVIISEYCIIQSCFLQLWKLLCDKNVFLLSFISSFCVTEG